MAQFTILGASGFIGGCLACRLTETGHQVFRPPRSQLRSLEGRELGHVFYSLGVDDAPDNPYDAFDSHIAYLVDVLRSCVYSSVTYLSSTRLYLGAESAREDAKLAILPDDENAIFNATKIAGEQICFAANKPAVRVVRMSNAIGFAPDGISLIPVLIKNAIKDGKMRLTISPQSTKDYIAIDDILDLLPRIAIGGKLRCYNIASGRNATLGEIVGIIQHELPSAAEWRAEAPRIIFPPVDISRIRSEFAFAPRSPMDALVHVCAQFRRHFIASVTAQA